MARLISERSSTFPATGHHPVSLLRAFNSRPTNQVARYDPVPSPTVSEAPHCAIGLWATPVPAPLEWRRRRDSSCSLDQCRHIRGPNSPRQDLRIVMSSRGSHPTPDRGTKSRPCILT